MENRPPATHRTIVVLDVEGFGARSRTNKNQLVVREGLKRAWQQAFRRAGIAWATCRVEDRGDGVFVLAPPDIPKALFVDVVPLELATALREHNTAHPPAEQIRVRMALHAGEVELDADGSTGAAIMLAFRLLSAQQLRDALSESPGTLALVTSDWFYDEVVRHSSLTSPAAFRAEWVSVKETTARAWISLPGEAAPIARASSGRSAHRKKPLWRRLRLVKA
jgi:class 3 adenylate cyclase